MPARHDLLVGALDFLWRPWGSIEVWEDAITYDLRRAGVTTMLVSDHPHLFEIGGENYHTDFTAWQYVRGHESDPWRTRPDPTWTGTPALPAEPGVRAPPVRRLAHVVPRRGGLPRAAHDASGRGVAADERASPRSLPVVRRRVRSARTVRHARAVGDRGTTPTWDGPRLIWPPYSTETIAKGRLATRRGPPDPRQLPVEAGDDRPLARSHPRPLDALASVGRHRGRALHRPRPLPRRARRVRQARHPDLLGPRTHAAAGRVARRGARARSTRSRPTSTCTRRSPTCSASRPRTAPTAGRSCR